MHQKNTQNPTSKGTAQGNVNISALVGREIYTAGGIFVGEVSDLKIDFEKESVVRLVVDDVLNTDIIDVESGKKGILIPYRWVRNVGDAIIVADFVSRLNTPSE